MSTENNTSSNTDSNLSDLSLVGTLMYDPNHYLVINFSNRKRLETDPAFAALYQQTVRVLDMTSVKNIPIPAGMRRKVTFDPATLLECQGSNGRAYVNCMYEVGPQAVGETTNVVISDKADIRNTSGEFKTMADYDEVPAGGPGGMIQYYYSNDEILDEIVTRLYHVSKPWVTGDFAITRIVPTLRVWFIDEPI